MPDVFLRSGAANPSDVILRDPTAADAGGSTAYSLVLDAGAFALTGGVLGMATGRKMSLAAGSFALTGNAVAMQAGRKLALVAGAFSLVGGDISMRAGRFVALEPGTFILTGADLDFVYTSGSAPVAYTLTLEAGHFVLTGYSMEFLQKKAVARYIPIPPSMPRYSVLPPERGPMVGGRLRTGRGRK
jgi:hypothetical protein